jgi:hypothetical protein
MLLTFITSMTKQTKHTVSIPPTTHMVFSHYNLSKNQPYKKRMPRDGQRVPNQLPPRNNWEFYSQLIPSNCTRISTIGRLSNSQIRTSNKNLRQLTLNFHNRIGPSKWPVPITILNDLRHLSIKGNTWVIHCTRAKIIQ